MRKETSVEPGQAKPHTASDQYGLIWMAQISQVQMIFSHLSAHPNAIFLSVLNPGYLLTKKRDGDTLPAGGRRQGAASCLLRLDRRLLNDRAHPT